MSTSTIVLLSTVVNLLKFFTDFSWILVLKEFHFPCEIGNPNLVSNSSYFTLCPISVISNVLFHFKVVWGYLLLQRMFRNISAISWTLSLLIQVYHNFTFAFTRKKSPLRWHPCLVVVRHFQSKLINNNILLFSSEAIVIGLHLAINSAVFTMDRLWQNSKNNSSLRSCICN